MARLTLFVVTLVAALSHGASALPQNPLGQKRGNPLAREEVDPLVGTWQGSELRVELRKDGRNYAGTFELAGARYPFTCRKAGKGLRGQLTADGESYEFTAEPTRDGMTFHSGGVDYPVTKVGAPGSSADPAGELPASVPKHAVRQSMEDASVPKTETFRHPLGFEFQHPRGWSVQSSDDGILVLPKGVEKDASGQPIELFLITAESAEGATRPDQAEVVAFFDQSLAQMLPGMKRKGKPESLDCLLGAGATIRYSGKTPTDFDGHADIYVTLHREMGIYMVHLGRKDLVEGHQAEARQMFSSFGWKKGKLDPNLAATWHREVFNFSSNLGYDGTTDSMSSSQHYYWQFKPDGTALYWSGGWGSVDVGSGSAGVSYGTSADPKNAYVGSWSVTPDKRVVVLWNGGGVETYSYSVFEAHENKIALKLSEPGAEKGEFFYRQ